MSFVKLQCPCCGKVFTTEYHHGGAIEHINSHRNMRVFVRRWHNNHNKNDLFLWAINLEGNHCNIKDNRIAIGRDIFNCTVTWMLDNDEPKIAQYLLGREDDIKVEDNRITLESIELLKQDERILRAKLL